MHLTWHIIKKDIRRFWPMSFFLALLIAMETWCGVHLLGHEGEFDSELFSRVMSYAGLLANLQMIVVVLFTAAVIQEDGFVSTQKSWMSRPISNRRMVAAKAGAIVLLLCAIPSCAAIPWWWYAGWGPFDVVAGVGKMATTSGVMILLAAPFALVTPTLGRFILSILFCLVVFIFTTVAFNDWASLGRDRLSPELMYSRSMVAAGLVVAASILVIVVQLRRRPAYVASSVLAGGILSWAIASVSWPWELPLFTTPAKHESALTQPITAQIGDVKSLQPEGVRSLSYRVSLFLADIPDGHFVTGSTGLGQRLIWADEEIPIRVTGPLSTSRAIPQVRKILGLAADDASPASVVRFESQLTIMSSVTDRFKEAPASYEFVGHFQLHTPLLLGQTPLQTDAQIEKANHRVRVLYQRLDSEGLQVNLIEAKPSRRRSMLVFNVGDSTDTVRYQEDIRHYVFNRPLQRVLRGERKLRSPTAFRTCTIAYVNIVWRELVFRGADDGLAGEESPAWSLASIAPGTSARFERRLTFPASLFSTE